MTISAACSAAGVTRKALRVYEEKGLLTPSRDQNGYRKYGTDDVRVLKEIVTLKELGISLADMAPFIDCLALGAERADACPASLVEYRRAIDRIDTTTAALTLRRQRLVDNLHTASRRMMDAQQESTQNYLAHPSVALPSDLPAPEADGAADHLMGTALPSLTLASTDGDQVEVGALGPGRVLLYVFPMTGSPERDMPEGWDAIPGARGCTLNNCDFRDHYADLLRSGIRRVYGLSSQHMDYQQGVAKALGLPYPLLTDEELRLANDPGLPTFVAGDLTLYRRQTLVVLDGVIEHVFYPVFPPDQHAKQVVAWLQENPKPARTP